FQGSLVILFHVEHGRALGHVLQLAGELVGLFGQLLLGSQRLSHLLLFLGCQGPVLFKVVLELADLFLQSRLFVRERTQPVHQVVVFFRQVLGPHLCLQQFPVLLVRNDRQMIRRCCRGVLRLRSRVGPRRVV